MKRINKRVIWVFLMLLGIVNVLQAQDDKATLLISYEGSKPPEKVYLRFRTVTNIQNWGSDTLSFDKGTIRYRLAIPDVTRVTLYDETGNSRSGWDRQAHFYINEPVTHVTIQDSLPNIVVQNAPINDRYQEFKAFTAKETLAFKTWNEKYNHAYSTANEGQLHMVDSIRPHRNRARAALDSVKTLFAMQNPDSWFSLEVIDHKVDDYIRSGIYAKDADERIGELNRLFDGISDGLMISPLGKQVAAKLKGAKTVVGNKIKDFSMPEKGGGTVDTKNMRGKVFLLDFWGSWCGWCRKGHPHLKALYDKYHAKGFEIISIADEGGTEEKLREKWLTAIEEDQIGHWKHVLNDPDVIDLTQAYGIGSFPTKFLVDREGRIILRVKGYHEPGQGPLDAKLAELLGE